MLLNTLDDLYEQLCKIKFLQCKVVLYDEKIEIVFHENFVLSIKLKIYYSVFINTVLCCRKIEEQDIWEVLHHYFDENIYYIEYDGRCGKSKIIELTQKQFECKKRKFIGKSNVSIFTIKELIYRS